MDGYELVALIFAREVNDHLTSLVKAIDRQVEQSAARHRSENKLGVHVVFCSDDPGLQQRLHDLIAKAGVRHVVVSLSREKAQGPPRYRIAREAELTAVIYKDEATVVANHVLDSMDLAAGGGEEILKSLRKVLP